MHSESVPSVQVDIERMATGGEAVGRLDDGRVIFVRGALPSERAAVEITEEKKRFARGIAVDIVSAAADERVEPQCGHAADRSCGGCDWMFIEPTAQRDYKRQLVIEQLQRLGGIDDPTVTSRDMQAGQRTTVRCTVTDGRAGYRKRRSDQAFVATECMAADPLLEELICEANFGDATEVTLRAGALTGDRLVMTDGDVSTVRVPAGVLVVSSDDPGDAAIYEEVAGTRWRISAKSFFQTSHSGAAHLVDSVRDALGADPGDVIDLYAGVGLLGGAAAPGKLLCSVESNPSSSADARHNLDANVAVEQARVERWTPRSCNTVIADPARRGLDKGGAKAVDQTGASRLVLVSCDPAALGRDTALLKEQGWRYDRGEVIDMFPDTSRIEVVSLLTR